MARLRQRTVICRRCGHDGATVEILRDDLHVNGPYDPICGAVVLMQIQQKEAEDRLHQLLVKRQPVAPDAE